MTGLVDADLGASAPWKTVDPLLAAEFAKCLECALMPDCDLAVCRAGFAPFIGSPALAAEGALARELASPPRLFPLSEGVDLDLLESLIDGVEGRLKAFGASSDCMVCFAWDGVEGRLKAFGALWGTFFGFLGTDRSLLSATRSIHGDSRARCSGGYTSPARRSEPVPDT